MNYTKTEFLKALLEKTKKKSKNLKTNNFYGSSIEGLILTKENLNAGLFDDLLKNDTPFCKALNSIKTGGNKKSKDEILLFLNKKSYGPYSDIVQDFYDFLLKLEDEDER